MAMKVQGGRYVPQQAPVLRGSITPVQATVIKGSAEGLLIAAKELQALVNKRPERDLFGEQNTATTKVQAIRQYMRDIERVLSNIQR